MESEDEETDLVLDDEVRQLAVEAVEEVILE